jgi:ribonuclease HI
MTQHKYEFVVNCDGSCRGNGIQKSSITAGGIITEIPSGEKSSFSKHFGPGTNNEAELLAISESLTTINTICYNKKWFRGETKITIHSDSQYAIGVCSGIYRANANAGLVASIRSLMLAFHTVEFVKVKAHSGHLGNEAADELAALAHGKKRKVIFSSRSIANLRDVYTFVETEVSLMPDWETTGNVFVLSPGKMYDIKITVSEV